MCAILNFSLSLALQALHPHVLLTSSPVSLRSALYSPVSTPSTAILGHTHLQLSAGLLSWTPHTLSAPFRSVLQAPATAVSTGIMLNSQIPAERMDTTNFIGFSNERSMVLYLFRSSFILFVSDL